MGKIKKITIRGSSGIGDQLFVTPTLRRIKEAYHKDYCVEVETRYPDLLSYNPFIDIINNNTVVSTASTSPDAMNDMIMDYYEPLHLGKAYPDPIRCKEPTEHHIMAVWKTICDFFNLETEEPKLMPEIYIPPELFPVNSNRFKGKIAVQRIHKGHWHGKKIWHGFDELVKIDGFTTIYKMKTMYDLVGAIYHADAVVCAEGGISHIAKAVGTPAVVIYGGFADPLWNGYKDHANIVNKLDCAYCYNSYECINKKCELLCMKNISVGMIANLAKRIPRRKKDILMERIKKSRIIESLKVI